VSVGRQMLDEGVDLPRETTRPVAPTDGTCCARWPLCGVEVTGRCCNAPTLAYPRCPCGGALDPRHRCVDPLARALSLHGELLTAIEGLTDGQQVEFRAAAAAQCNERIRAVTRR